ncbi:hypothetical protein EG328_004522 [Venturia inaequalis]|uniref:Uncharacterized protein n=1 Tax=Venturia inaequalis TaxID=5025 RepID=A0A8H3YTI0_VENIN|nr:hypothetical protein EG328_004522 [Venturia inaequalis]
MSSYQELPQPKPSIPSALSSDLQQGLDNAPHQEPAAQLQEVNDEPSTRNEGGPPRANKKLRAVLIRPIVPEQMVQSGQNEQASRATDGDPFPINPSHTSLSRGNDLTAISDPHSVLEQWISEGSAGDPWSPYIRDVQDCSGQDGEIDLGEVEDHEDAFNLDVKEDGWFGLGEDRS